MERAEQASGSFGRMQNKGCGVEEPKKAGTQRAKLLILAL